MHVCSQHSLLVLYCSMSLNSVFIKNVIDRPTICNERVCDVVAVASGSDAFGAHDCGVACQCGISQFCHANGEFFCFRKSGKSAFSVAAEFAHVLVADSIFRQHKFEVFFFEPGHALA